MADVIDLVILALDVIILVLQIALLMLYRRMFRMSDVPTIQLDDKQAEDLMRMMDSIIGDNYGRKPR